jgi:hypothetical protein
MADGVKEKTNLWVTWKRKASDDSEKLPGAFVQMEEIDTLRAMWLATGKPRVPQHEFRTLHSILQKSGITFQHSQSSAFEFVEHTLSQHSENEPPE